MRRWMIIGLLLVLALPAGCASFSDSARMGVFEATARSYERAIRWSEFENAYGFVRAPAGAAVPDFEQLKNIRVTNYDEIGAKLLPDGKTVEQIIRVQYVRTDRMAVRTLTVIQRWQYDDKEKRWFLQKGLPEFR
ncbi:MAG: hypothetical protein AABZ50_08515 [Pseudomonadota bacterium]